MKRKAEKKRHILKAGLAVIAVMLLLAGTGCRSMIELAKMEQAARLEPKPMKVEEFCSEAEGYHYPGFRWGDDFSAFQRATDFSVTDMEGYTEEETVYTASELKVALLDRVNDAAAVGCRGKDLVAFVSLNYEKKANESEEFDTFAKALREQLVQAFGEPVETLEHNEEVNGKLYNYKTEFWRKLVGEKLTELQLGTATLPGSSSPNYLSIGVNFRTEEDTAQ